MSPPVGVVAIDIDGTLLDSRYRLSVANLRALRNAHSQAVSIVLATGRRHRLAMPVSAVLGFKPFIISSHGALTRSPEGNTIGRNAIKASVVSSLLREMRMFADCTVLTVDRPDFGPLVVEDYDRLSQSTGEWITRERLDVVEVGYLLSVSPEDILQISICDRFERIVSAVTHLRATSVATQVRLSWARHAGEPLASLEIVSREATKGEALARLCRQLKVPRARVAAIGDAENDLDMIDYAKYSFLVANAADHLKKRAWRVTRSNDEDGVAHALDLLLEMGTV